MLPREKLFIIKANVILCFVDLGFLFIQFSDLQYEFLLYVILSHRETVTS